MDWKSYGNEDIVAAVQSLNAKGRNIELKMYPFDNHIENDDKNFIGAFSEDLKEEAPDFVMSFNYHPAVSVSCNSVGVKYAAWVYDNPSLRLFSYTTINPCNYIFLFDSQVFYSTRFKNLICRVHICVDTAA